MTAFGWTAIVVGCWLIASALAAPRIGHMLRRVNEPPPPPPADDRDPLADQPVEVLTGDALEARFRDVINSGWIS